MLCTISSLQGRSMQARDGQIGSVNDLLVEDDTWGVRWLVVDTGSWLFGRKVLIPASHLRPIERGATSIPVDLTCEQVENSPGTGIDLPISRQMETSLYSHYGLAPYWGPAAGMSYAPPIAYPAAGVPMGDLAAPSVAPGTGSELAGAGRDDAGPSGDSHLRSTNEITGYNINARDGDLGHVEDFVVDCGGWTIRYLVVDTKNWWPGKKVLVSPEWIVGVAWGDRAVRIDRTRHEIKSAPEFDPERPIDGDLEKGLPRDRRAAS